MLDLEHVVSEARDDDRFLPHSPIRPRWATIAGVELGRCAVVGTLGQRAAGTYGQRSLENPAEPHREPRCQKLERQSEASELTFSRPWSAKIPSSHASDRHANQQKPFDITTILANAVSAQDGIPACHRSVVLCLAKTLLRSPSVPSVADAARPALPLPSPRHCPPTDRPQVCRSPAAQCALVVHSVESVLPELVSVLHIATKN